MLVKDLIEKLQKQNPNDIVTMCTDIRQDTYCEAEGVSSDYIFKDNTIEDIRGKKNPKGQKCVVIL